jgi:hypothetical protein
MQSRNACWYSALPCPAGDMPGMAPLDGLALGDDADALGVLADVPDVADPVVIDPPDVVADAPGALADAPGALALPLPLGALEALALPGDVADALADAPGVALVMDPLDAEVPALPATCAAACWLHVSKSACVWAAAGSAVSARATASGIARVKVAMTVFLLERPAAYK